MQVEMQLTSEKNGQTVISLSVPSSDAPEVADAIRGFLILAGHTVMCDTNRDESCVSVEGVFPDASPAMLLRGYRGKMGWTQQEMAEKLGSTQGRLSDLESGRRAISKDMARRLAKLFDIPYRVFL